MKEIYRALINGKPFEHNMWSTKSDAVQSAMDIIKSNAVGDDFVLKPTCVELKKNNHNIVDAYKCVTHSVFMDECYTDYILIESFNLA